jgi:hypothetical protein
MMPNNRQQEINRKKRAFRYKFESMNGNSTGYFPMVIKKEGFASESTRPSRVQFPSPAPGTNPYTFGSFGYSIMALSSKSMRNSYAFSAYLLYSSFYDR